MDILIDDSMYRPARHEDFEKDFDEIINKIEPHKYYKRAKLLYACVPGGWCVMPNNVAGGVCFVPFPKQYVLKENFK